MNRRTFLAAAAAAPLARPAAALPVKKAVLWMMLPKNLSAVEKCKLAIDCGYEAMEMPTMTDEREAEEVKKAADAAKLRIHSVMNQAHWKYPLSSADPAEVAESVKGMQTSLRNAKLWGADTVLLVPAVVNPSTSYKDAWTRSTAQIKKLIPMAQDLKVIIAVEEVWNKFLLSPLEFSNYVDQFQTPWVRAYFDVGNVAISGYPQDWIRTLGKRIVKLHFKEFTFKNRTADFNHPLGEGEIDWKAVHDALAEIGYSGYATVEVKGGDADYLKDVNRRFDRILKGEWQKSNG